MNLDCHVEDFYFDSTNGRNKVHAKAIFPTDINKIKGIVQISHGMCEYVECYENFAQFLLDNGYAFCGNDHIGHGNSVLIPEERGFFASENGYQYLIKDLYKMTKCIQKKFPNTPCFLLGHSMGSLIARLYAAKFGEEIQGLLLCGTMGPQWMIDAGIQLAEFMIQKKGALYRSKKLDRLAFEFANVNFEPIKTKYDWTCSDENVVKKHLADDKGNFIFTVSGFKDLFYLEKFCNDEKKITNTPKKLPIFLFSGDMDPVGEEGKGVQKVYQLYQKIGVQNIEMKLYHNMRHEMLNEVNKEEVYKDILDWMDCIRLGEE